MKCHSVNFLHYPVTSYLIRQNTLLWAMLSKISIYVRPLKERTNFTHINSKGLNCSLNSCDCVKSENALREFSLVVLGSNISSNTRIVLEVNKFYKNFLL
jgi:hypothetical protein